MKKKLLTCLVRQTSLFVAAPDKQECLPDNARLIPCWLIFLLICFSHAQSDFDKVGTAGAQFLKLGVGARANGMGGAYLGITNGAEAAFWNPAGLAKIEKRDVDFSHLSWIADIRHDALSYAHHWSGVGVFALSFVQLGAPDMEVTTTQQQEGTGEMFTYRDLAIGLSYARNLTDAFAVGITVKYIDEQIYTYHARGVAFDIGTQYRTGFYSLSISFAISNFGQDLRFGGAYQNTEVVAGTNTMLSQEREFASFPLPLRFSGGLTYDLLNLKSLKSRIALDGLHFNDYSERIHLGSENWIRDILALRAGYKFNYQEEGLTLGLGLQTRIDNFYLRVDYAYSDLGVFDRVDTFSVNFSF